MKNELLSLLLLVSCATTKASKLTTKIESFESDANGFNTKNFFYDNGHEVVVMDTQFTPKLAEESIKFIQSKTKSPIKYVIITHPNPDKFNGISAFQKLGAKVIASRETADSMAEVHGYKKFYFVNLAKMFTDETYPALNKPDIVFDENFTLNLSKGDKLEITELGRSGVSTNQTVVYSATSNALFVGDLIHHKAHAWLEGGIANGSPKPDLSAWATTLNVLKTKFPADALVVGGRGQSAPLEIAVEDQITYLEKLDLIVTQQVRKAGKGSEQYDVLQAQAEKAFPDYDLGYMIKYGVYGLVNSK